MHTTTTISLITLLGCAPAVALQDRPGTQVWVRSHNRSPVDIYVLCGERQARWLGEVIGRGSDALDIPADAMPCARGLNFFLVHQSSGKGYWVGPFRLDGGELVELVVEKYAALSNAQVRRGRL